jgi:hypothetical protein
MDWYLALNAQEAYIDNNPSRLFAHADDPEPTLEATESATSLGSVGENGAPFATCQPL